MTKNRNLFQRPRRTAAFPVLSPQCNGESLRRGSGFSLGLITHPGFDSAGPFGSDCPVLDPELELIADTLEQNDNYRVLRRLQPVSRYEFGAPAEGRLFTGIFLDTETTGLDQSTDSVIELAMVPFEYSADGRIYRILEAFDQLQDPGRPIPAEVVALTGITDEMVRGKAIDLGAAASVLETADLVIAHNASFDRPFVERLLSAFADKPWACSVQQVPWREEGIASSRLDYIASTFGFFFEGHRAEIDCRAGIEILAETLPSSRRPVLKVLRDAAATATIRIWAERAPFDMKDTLKARGYRWNPGDDGNPKAWYCDVEESQEAEEMDFLSEEIYGGRRPKLRSKRISARERFSHRI